MKIIPNWGFLVTVYRKYSFKARALVEKNRCLLSIFDKCRSYLHLQTTFASPYSKSDTLVVRRKELSCSVSHFFFGGGGGGGIHQRQLTSMNADLFPLDLICSVCTDVSIELLFPVFRSTER